MNLSKLVKPLVWQDFESEFMASEMGLAWRVWQRSDGLWSASRNAPDHRNIGVFPQREAAQAAAQADYTARILAAIDTDALQGLVEALAASRETHCAIAEHILQGGKDTKAIFADSQRERMAIDAALANLKGSTE